MQWLNRESDDFRQKVMQAIELDGLKKSEASRLFNISRNTINLWFQRKAETGDVKPKPRQASQQNGKISDWEKFRNFVKTHGDKTQTEMAQLWDGEISQRTISRALRKIGNTRKKKHTGIANGMKPNGQPTRAQLENPKAPHLVYVSESGMDERFGLRLRVLTRRGTVLRPQIRSATGTH